jgi:hypothetical protein
MNLSDIQSFIDKKVSAKEFSLRFKKEAEEYHQALSKKCSSVSIDLVEDTDVNVSLDALKYICKSFCEGVLSSWEVYYLVDALLLSERVHFETEDLFDLFSGLTDPEVNGELTKEYARSLI